MPTPHLVTLITGPEELLAERAVADVVGAVRAVDPAAEVVRIAASSAASGAVAEAAAPSLFGERRVVVVSGLHEAGDEVIAQLKRYLADPAEDVHLVLLHAKGPRGSGVLTTARSAGAAEVRCAELRTRRDRLGFLAEEFTRHRRRAEPAAVNALLDAVGGDLRELAAAAAQLCADTTGTVDVAAVRRYYEGHAEVSGFAVADLAVTGQTGPALVALRHALATGTDPVLVVAALAMGLRAIVRVGSAGRALRDADLAREIGLPPWKVGAVRKQLPGWDGAGASIALTAVAQADAAVKGGQADPAYALERAVITVAAARGAAGGRRTAGGRSG